mgnify:CR=1 FL=1
MKKKIESPSRGYEKSSKVLFWKGKNTESSNGNYLKNFLQNRKRYQLSN